MVAKSPEECACGATAIQEWDLLGRMQPIVTLLWGILLCVIS